MFLKMLLDFVHKETSGLGHLTELLRYAPSTVAAKPSQPLVRVIFNARRTSILPNMGAQN